MVQIIQSPERKSRSQQFGEAFSRLAHGSSEHLFNEHRAKQEVDAINRLTGLDVSNLPREMLPEFIKNRDAMFQDEENYDLLKNTFGEHFANVWKAAPVGGKTELLKHGLQSKSRNQDINETLSGIPESPKENQNHPMDQPMSELSQNTPQLKFDQKVPKDYKWQDYAVRPSGYTPKEWRDERKVWRQENVPVFKENKTRLKSNARDALDIKRLIHLNYTKGMNDVSRWLINPNTGDFYGLAQIGELVPPEVQEYAKIFARFQNRAKDAFGSRVTNFDLQQYMKQFPGLLNSKDGRSRILQMMTINNQLDQLYENSLNQIYQHYGLNGIPQEKADELAQSFIQKETEKLEQEYLNLDNENMKDSGQGLSGRMVDVIGPDGQEYEIDEREVETLPKGFRLV